MQDKHLSGMNPSPKMKVALAGTVAGWGGIRTHLLMLSRALLQDGHQVLILSLGGEFSEDDRKSIDELRLLGSLEVRQPNLQARGRGAANSILRALREFQPDIYLCCGTGWNLFIPAIISRAKPIRVFYEVMSGEPSSWRDTRHLARMFFDAVIAQASRVALNFGRYFHWKRPITVLPAFSESLEITARVPQAVRRPVKLGTAKAGFFSRLAPHKRGLWLVQQWPRLSGLLRELHLFGSGPEEQDIRNLIAAKGWEDRVFCHGPYPSGQEYVDLMRSFDLTLLPTVGSEGAPLVLLESMACGVPFVSTDAGGIPDYRNPDCMITPVESDEDYLKAVESMAAALDAGEIDQSRLQQCYNENFSFKKLADRWLCYLLTLHDQSSRCHECVPKLA